MEGELAVELVYAAGVDVNANVQVLKLRLRLFGPRSRPIAAGDDGNLGSGANGTIAVASVAPVGGDSS